jgi:FkbM family methyltransferase
VTLRRRLWDRARDAVRLSRFGSRPIDRLRVVLLITLMPVLRRHGLSRPTRLRLRIGDTVVDWSADNDADVAVLAEIFDDRVYDFPLAPPPRVIVDLGGHVGASVLYFALRYPEARLVVVEPDPVNFAKLRRNVGHLAQVTAINAAVSDHEGTITLHSAGGLDSWKSSTSGVATPWSHPVEVRAAKLDSILAEAGVTAVDLLKIDIEGAEYEVLRSFDGLRDVQLIAGEVHPHLISAPLADFRRLLDEFELDMPAEVPHDMVFSARRRQSPHPAR